MTTSALPASAQCQCGQALTKFRQVNDRTNGISFFIQRCDGCGKITVIRNDGTELAAN